MGTCASDRKGGSASSASGASIGGGAFFHDELDRMIGRENDGKSRREDGSTEGGGADSSRSSGGSGPDLRLPQSEVARNELSRELNMHFNSPAVLARMWDAYTTDPVGMTLSEVRTLVVDVLVRSHRLSFAVASVFGSKCFSLLWHVAKMILLLLTSVNSLSSPTPPHTRAILLYIIFWFLLGVASR
jgi:hypothetical protein